MMKWKIYLLLVSYLMSCLVFGKSYAPVTVTHEVLQQLRDNQIVARITIEITDDLRSFSAQIKANEGLALIDPVASINKTDLPRGHKEEFDVAVQLHHSVAYLAVIIQTENQYGVPLAKSAVLKFSDSDMPSRQFKSRATHGLKLMPGSPR